MYVIKLTRDLPPFTRDGCTVEDIYYLGTTLENLIDAVIKFGGLLTTNPTARRGESDRIVDSTAPEAQLPTAVTDAIAEMAREKRKVWVVVVTTPPKGQSK